MFDNASNNFGTHGKHLYYFWTPPCLLGNDKQSPTTRLTFTNYYSHARHPKSYDYKLKV